MKIYYMPQTNILYLVEWMNSHRMWKFDYGYDIHFDSSIPDFLVYLGDL